MWKLRLAAVALVMAFIGTPFAGGHSGGMHSTEITCESVVDPSAAAGICVTDGNWFAKEWLILPVHECNAINKTTGAYVADCETQYGTGAIVGTQPNFGWDVTEICYRGWTAGHNCTVDATDFKLYEDLDTRAQYNYTTYIYWRPGQEVGIAPAPNARTHAGLSFDYVTLGHISAAVTFTGVNTLTVTEADVTDFETRKAAGCAAGETYFNKTNTANEYIARCDTDTFDIFMAELGFVELQDNLLGIQMDVAADLGQFEYALAYNWDFQNPDAFRDPPPPCNAYDVRLYPWQDEQLHQCEFDDPSEV